MTKTSQTYYDQNQRCDSPTKPASLTVLLTPGNGYSSLPVTYIKNFEVILDSSLNPVFIWTNPVALLSAYIYNSVPLTVSATVAPVWPKPPLSCLGCYNSILMLCSSTPGPPQQLEGYVKSVCQNSPMASYVTQSNDQIPSVFHSHMCLASALTSPKSNKDLSPVTSLSSLVLGLFFWSRMMSHALTSGSFPMLSLILEYSFTDICTSGIHSYFAYFFIVLKSHLIREATYYK